jgi:hypothetical protein
MANLLGQNIGTNYKGILNLDTINTPLDATLRAVTDGEGNASGLKLSTTDSSFSGNVGIGTNAPSAKFVVQTTSAADGITLKDASNNLALIGKWFDSSGFIDLSKNGTSYARIQANSSYISSTLTIGVASALAATLAVKGSGTTSATTALLVQNSAGSELFKVTDNGAISSLSTFTTLGGVFAYGAIEGAASGQSGSFSGSVRVGSGGSNNASAILDAVSTTKGFLPPRMTTTQKNAISSPAAGLVVYDTDTNKLTCYNGTTWNDLF